jgi:mannose-6-phosphate isomerase-like protein (cupin superfamily)
MIDIERARSSTAEIEGGSTMSGAKQHFSVSRAEDAVYKTGLRSFMEYRDLGIEQATQGRFRAHVIRIKHDSYGAHDLHTTGLHQHECDFQMFYVLKGWIRFVYEGQGEHTFHAGDCVLQPPGIVHNELECSDDVEVLEIYSPAQHETVVVGKKSEAAAAY